MNSTLQTTQKQKQKISGFTFIELLIVLAIVALLWGLLMPQLSQAPELESRLACGKNMKELYIAMDTYAQDNNGNYPTAQNWCDLLVKQSEEIEKLLMCNSNKDARSTYAINPNCQPSSPNDIVLLFETKAGWNQHGGPELLTNENHQGKGCNILYNNGTVRFERTGGLELEKWKAEQETALKWKIEPETRDK